MPEQSDIDAEFREIGPSGKPTGEFDTKPLGQRPDRVDEILKQIEDSLEPQEIKPKPNTEINASLKNAQNAIDKGKDTGARADNLINRLNDRLNKPQK